MQSNTHTSTITASRPTAERSPFARGEIAGSLTLLAGHSLQLRAVRRMTLRVQRGQVRVRIGGNPIPQLLSAGAGFCTLDEELLTLASTDNAQIRIEWPPLLRRARVKSGTHPVTRTHCLTAAQFAARQLPDPHPITVG